MAVTCTETATRTAPTDGGLRVEHPAEGVRVLVLDRRERRNSLDLEVFIRLAHELAVIRTDSAVRSVILTGANGAFSSGADFASLEDLSRRAETEVAELLARQMRVVEMLWTLPQPTIAAIDGPAVGAGMSLALACDIRVGSPTMALFPSFIRMGLLPDMGASWLLPRLIGEGAALQLLLAGRPIDAESALRIGLVHQLSDDAFAAALDLATTFAARPAPAVVATKRLLREAADGDLAQAVDLEAGAQAAAIHGSEFAGMFATWRAARVFD
ncbi:MAG: 2-(1,2-epoxy,2-dihydrophenyl)acetyl-CoA isomerase [Mycobacterium sp.]|jgi:enoyl-CoA hydratase/carnithine racemase|nr:2-(1,2-epoxy,2-dihydrophenyl)acetyl-CoA isomerase [Mycobacterium sp.]MDT5305111.1 2-(1,2-epoxy,2-dihydrophenyl)acetyl-CoA isomerase [Mycobacterium sp.]MDT5342352.1 2-(1,2-epoxy,2-dihydrophenyl)acetyl-CoA isomerase [Mycobacterium sp.]